MNISHLGLHGTPQTYYEVLDISPALLSDQAHQPAQLVKRAYHRALLRHHPDKAKSETANRTPPSAHLTGSNSRGSPEFTIDQITVAYKTLSDPKSRAAYDLSLYAASASARAHGPFGHEGRHHQGGAGVTSFQTGVENVDLDDLPFDEAQDCWYRGCRCGNDRGFVFAETDLEDAGAAGELLVGCRDCSLWMKVHFAIMDE
ncbi:hypothetical protein SODALDRAFT_325052 [Sodiomyces alkalinus F11]|uniref:Diphthamide biosynthesis protein 4 n=1 Tax=Sodiomyces alkalinus (strain CBS 110278 / VKM F-3762 / F11) TaxID=1314773 RepID=A0A3N2PSJ1_SODAK|nr:hypothetical protein SODALDRAFT_325052 [Sodiomyces alkalinus F11]ROT37450.1 hypothetical protein SODALDRAFT_325052 [Sodiomyces alkalinus F11]